MTADTAATRFYRRHLMHWPTAQLIDELRVLAAIEAMDGFDDAEYPIDVIKRTQIDIASQRQAINDILGYRERYGIEVPEPTFGYSRDVIDQVKARRRVEDEVSLVTRLRRSGKSLRGECPMSCALSGDRSDAPALAVWPDTDRWHCFRCNAGGDVIAWLMAWQGWEFPEAVSYLAGVAGVELEKEARESGRESNSRVSITKTDDGSRPGIYSTPDRRESFSAFEYRRGRTVKS